MKTILRSNDLSCPSCVAKVEASLARVPGVSEAKVRFNSGRIVIEHDHELADVETLQETIRSLGYETEVSPL